MPSGGNTSLPLAEHWVTICVCADKAVSMLQGKYVEIQFSRGGEPEGGVIYNFLLEKVSGMQDMYRYLCFL